MLDSEGKRELQKVIAELLKQNIKSTHKVLDVINNFFPEESKNVLDEYDRINVNEYMLSVSGEREHILINVPEMSSRRSESLIRLQYEDTLIRLLSEYKVSHNIEPLKESLIVYEHLVNKGRIKDNDNYNVYESKNILDCIVSAGIIKDDEGKNCIITHMSTITDELPGTIIHVIKCNAKEYMRSVTSCVTNSVTNGNF